MRQYLAQIEGVEFEHGDIEEEDDMINETLLSQMNFLGDDEIPESSYFYTSSEETNAYNTISSLHQKLYKHTFTLLSPCF